MARAPQFSTATSSACWRGTRRWRAGQVAAAVQKALWAHAERYTPRDRVAEYTQAIMDLGATLCTRTRPRCGECPLTAACKARVAGLQGVLPTPRPRRARPQRDVRMLLITNADREVLLERRPPSGIWGGLYSLPELAAEDDPQGWCRRLSGRGYPRTQGRKPRETRLQPLRPHDSPAGDSAGCGGERAHGSRRVALV